MVTDPDWPTFLAARLDEQEHIFKGMWGDIAAYMVADIEAKRAIINEYQRVDKEADIMSSFEEARHAGGLHKSIEMLCRPFKDHPDWPGRS